MTKELIIYENIEPTNIETTEGMYKSAAINGFEVRSKRCLDLTVDDINWCDLVYSIRSSSAFEKYLSKECRKLGKFWAYMLDDDFLSLGDDYGTEGIGYRQEFKDCIVSILQNTDCLIAVNKFLADKYSRIGNIKKTVLINTAVDIEKLPEPVRNEGKKKLVIFARFLPEVHEIERLTEKILGKNGMKAVAIYGEIKKEDRGDIVQQFQTDPATMAFIGQIDTAGTGITLTAADTCVYYSVNFNYATYSQSLSRIHRIGQHHPCTYIHLVVEKSVDSQILTSLSKKEDLAKTVVDDWRQFFNGKEE